MKIQSLPQSHYYNYKNSNQIKFGQRINLDDIEKNLSFVRSNDFISDVYEHDILNAEKITFKKNKINQYFKSKINFNTNFFDNAPADAPFKFAALIKKLVFEKKDATIIENTPKIFKEIPIKKLVNALNTLSYDIRTNYLKYKKEAPTISINNKPIDLKYIGKGGNSIVFKLSDKNGESVAMKNYINPDDVSNYSLFGELAVYHDLHNEKINNIPKLYIANPITEKVEDKSLELSYSFVDIDDVKDYDGYKGGWTLIDYISESSAPEKEGRTLQNWLNEKHLYHNDLSCDNVKNGFIVDLGGIDGQ